MHAARDRKTLSLSLLRFPHGDVGEVADRPAGNRPQAPEGDGAHQRQLSRAETVKKSAAAAVILR